MLLLAHDEKDILKALVAKTKASLPAAVVVAGEVAGMAYKNKNRDGIEHFGYVDGRSQPLMLKEDVKREKHEGGTKFVMGDDAYKGFRSWIEDVAAIRGDKYAAAKDLPAADVGPEKFGTELWLKLTNCPPEWADKFLLVRVFAWDAKAKKWEVAPIAVSDRVVFGKGKLWQHTLTLLAEKESTTICRSFIASTGRWFCRKFMPLSYWRRANSSLFC